MKMYYEGLYEVEYDYQPYEAPDRSGYPGCDPQITLTSVLWNGVEVIDAVKADQNVYDAFADLCLDDALDKERSDGY